MTRYQLISISYHVNTSLGVEKLRFLDAKNRVTWIRVLDASYPRCLTFYCSELCNLYFISCTCFLYDMYKFSQSVDLLQYLPAADSALPLVQTASKSN
jgi:hypothetical protein